MSNVSLTIATACAVVAVTCVLTAIPARACSVFVLASDSTVVLGQNLDWREPFPGNVVVSPSGITKAMLPFATVDEVILHIEDLRPDGEGWHYLATDSTGAFAVIEYLDGCPTVLAGDQIEVPAITNTAYRQAMSHLHMDIAFGGDLDIAAGSDSYGRFVRMATLMRDYRPATEGPAAAYAFLVLDQVAWEQTLRTVVYDATARAVCWRTRKQQEARWLDFDSLDLSSGAPVLIVDVEAAGQSDISLRLEPYTVEANRVVVSATMGHGPEELINLIAEHPTAFETPPAH